MTTIIGSLLLGLCIFYSVYYVMTFIIHILKYQFNNKLYNKINAFNISKLDIIILSLLWSLLYWYSHYFNY
jgi:hypothetical protein